MFAKSLRKLESKATNNDSDPLVFRSSPAFMYTGPSQASGIPLRNAG
jgi:hypothetical protein